MKNINFKLRFKISFAVFTFLNLLFFGFKSSPNLYANQKKEITNEVNSKVEKIFTNEQEASLYSVEDNPYILGPGDKIFIKLLGIDDSGRTLIILNDGSISIPIIGSFIVKGMTIKEATYHLENNLKKELLIPKVELYIIKQRSISISVLGEVERPGLYTLKVNDPVASSSEDNPNYEIPTVINAIQVAGGITPYSNLKKVSIKRLIPGGANKYKQTSLNLIDLILEGDQTQNLHLFDGDILTIKKVNEFLDEEDSRILTANLSPRSIRINIAGEVVKPGSVLVKPNIPLVQAIYEAGGPLDWRANQNNAQLIRVNNNGSITYKKFRININEKASSKKNPLLKDGDIINIGKNNFAKATDAIGAVSSPFQGIITIWSLFKIVQ